MSNFQLKAVPTFRISNYAEAMKFYVDLLGFKIEWEHRFSETEPVYMEVSLNGLHLHLSENKRFEGGSVVYVETTGVEKLRTAIINRKKEISIPEITNTPWGTRQLEMTDPFGNLLRFNEYA